MIEAAKYSAVELLRNGSLVEIRALRDRGRSFPPSIIVAPSRSIAGFSAQGVISRKRRSHFS
jgi:hypothetical protein